MGQRGPAPKRSTQRRRQNKESEPEVVTVPADKMYGEPLKGEHAPVASRFWEALRRSGQAQFYEPSDWAAAELVVLAIDAFAGKPSAMMLASLNSAMSSLLVTEADRRRVRLELEREAPDAETSDDADVAVMDDYRRRVAR